jgi:hypothetical protein
MRMKHIGARLAVAAVTGALIAAPQVPAFAATAAAPTISITAKSALPRITGDVLVVWRSSSAGSATISGSITNGVAGEIVKLYARQFPFTKPAAPIGTPITLTTNGTSPYSFTATPTLATRYTVKLFASATATTPLATSTRVTVFVASNAHIGGFRLCSRPICHERFHIRVLVPASTLRTEKGKKWHDYFGIRFSRTGLLRPRTLTLGAGHPHFSPARKLNSHEFAVTLTLSFFVGNHGYNFLIFPCQRDTEAKDGLNLPGHHGCGTLRTISSHRIYLG